MATYDQIAFANNYKSSAMQLIELLHKSFQTQLPFIHEVRLKSLMDAVKALINVNKLTLTLLGRNLLNQSKTRSNIKKLDRLLGNAHLYEERLSFYKLMSDKLITEVSAPVIHVDWSCICSVTDLYVLRASLSMPGRSIVIYEECHTKKNDNHHPTHKAFLKRLKANLPLGVKPIIVTDAGFRGPWFTEVRAMGWDFVGRVRNKNLIFLGDTWHLSKSLYQGATEMPKYLGEGFLTAKLKVPVKVVLYKGKKKNRHKLKKNKKRSKDGNSKKYSRAYKEPWLLVTSLKCPAKEIVKLYSYRMQIEENFRDTKCTRYGFGLKESRTRSPERMNILLLIGAIATYACWLASIEVKESGAASDYQAHSSKFTSVLSSVYLGREALKKGVNIITERFNELIKGLFQMIKGLERIPTC